jgi:hypothetical protein
MSVACSERRRAAALRVRREERLALNAAVGQPPPRALSVSVPTQ